MIFVDTNVFMYAVDDPSAPEKRTRLLLEGLDDPSIRLYTSAEVLQELLHVYLPVERLATLDAAFQLAESCMDEIWAVEAEDVGLARSLGRYSAGDSSLGICSTSPAAGDGKSRESRPTTVRCKQPSIRI